MKSRITINISEIGANIVATRQKTLQCLLTNVFLHKFVDGLGDTFQKFFLSESIFGNADDASVLVQQIGLIELIQGWQQFAPGQVSFSAKEYKIASFGLG